MSLPDDLLLSCIARVSRLYYPSVSLVSKRFRSLIVSPELYKIRSLLGHTDSCLYVCLSALSYEDCPRWFTLSQKPDQTIKKEKKSSGYFLARVSPPDSPRVSFSGLVAVGSNIYNIAGSKSCAPSSIVWIMDCRTHTWHEAPSFQLKLLSLSARVVDQKIYVARRDGDSSTKMVVEVFDPKTEIWDPVPIPYFEAMRDFAYFGSACIDGKFHLMTKGPSEVVSAYNSKEGRWDHVGQGMGNSMHSEYYCVIKNVLYSVYNCGFRWYDTEARMWRELKGLVGLPKFRFPPTVYCVKLADYGGKMAVFWQEYYTHDRFDSMMIWCAEIALERRNTCEIWGKVEWFDHVLTVPRFCGFVKVLAATV